jgi:hypothetical protein
MLTRTELLNILNKAWDIAGKNFHDQFTASKGSIKVCDGESCDIAFLAGSLFIRGCQGSEVELGM